MAGPPLTTSATTVGGCTFEELCNGTVVNYACDNTVDIRGCDFEQAKQMILTHIDDCITTLEIGRERTVEEFYIGKTNVQRRKAPRGYVTIDPRNHWTYRKGGIGSRWREHRNNSYGRDGMIVLTIIPRDALPSTANPKLHQEDYAFALEQTLLHHFMITHYDHRIANDGFATGGTDIQGSAAYALYMAFRLEDDLSDSDSDVIIVGEERSMPEPQAHSTLLTNTHTHAHTHLPHTIFPPTGNPDETTANNGSTVHFHDPLVTSRHKYEQPRRKRRQRPPTPSQSPSDVSC